jgi:hypothetical protein
VIGRHIRAAGIKAVEQKVAEMPGIAAPTLGGLKAKKTRELGSTPDAMIPKVVAFPTS